MNNFNENKKEGAFQIARSLFQSDIWFKPPEYLKIWIYLIGKANHKTRKYKGYTCKRGQYFTNYKELGEQLKYNIGYRKRKVNESTVKNIMKYLRENQMITTMKKPRGILVDILNYNDYQNLSNYEKTKYSDNEETNSKPDVNQDTQPINKNEEELNNSRVNMINETPENLEYVTLEETENNKIDFNRELSENEVDLINDFIEWAYNPDNKFNLDKSVEETSEYIENTIRAYGFEAIHDIFSECSEGRLHWDVNEEELSAYSQFWKQTHYLKYIKEEEHDLKLKNREKEIIKYIEGRSGISFKCNKSPNLLKLLQNGINNNEIVKYFDWYLKCNKSNMDNITIDKIFSTKNWNKYLKLFNVSNQQQEDSYKEVLRRVN